MQRGMDKECHCFHRKKCENKTLQQKCSENVKYPAKDTLLNSIDFGSGDLRTQDCNKIQDKTIGPSCFQLFSHMTLEAHKQCLKTVTLLCFLLHILQTAPAWKFHLLIMYKCQG